MSSQITTYFANLLADNVFGGDTSPALPSTYYIGLSSTTPTAAGGNVTEPTIGSATGYSRLPRPSFDAASGGIVQNSAAISFSNSVTAWGTMTHWTIWDEATGGHLLFFGAFNSPKVVTTQTLLTFLPGGIKLGFIPEA